MPRNFSLPGKVYLIGAGPGRADLLTLRAFEILRRADVVLHDDLVFSEVLQVIPASAVVLNVGKRCGQKKITQEQIHERMIAEARQGRTVVRLKGGDPLIFGRAQDEMQALRQAEIEFEVVPGITAALAAAAAAQIPLTERRSASKLLFVSNHQCDEKVLRNWRSNVVSDTTLVFYMPGREFSELVEDLRGGGLAPDTPCLLVSNATLPQQELIRTTLSELSATLAPPTPSLLIVGSMVAEGAGAACRGTPGFEEILTLHENKKGLELDRKDAAATRGAEASAETNPVISV